MMAGPEATLLSPKTGRKNSAHRRFSWRKWLVRALVAAGVVTVTIAVVGSVIFGRIERDADRVAEIGTSLKIFANLFAGTLKDRELDQLLALHDDAYSSADEGLWETKQQSDRDGVRVYSWYAGSPRPYQKSDLEAQYENFLASAGTIQESKLKINAIEEFGNDGTAVIRAILWLRGKTDAGETRESRATFRMNMVQRGQDWLVLGKQLIDGQTVIGPGRGFVDVTDVAGIEFEAARNPLLEDPTWSPQMYEIFRYSTAGVTAADYDNDGWYDIFFCDGDRPCLYRNQGDGTFQDVTSTAGLPVGMDGVHVAIFADFDNDGDRDLFLGRSTGDNLLFENLGTGQFADVTADAGVSGVWVVSAAAADYDNDGLVDIYLGRYLDPRTEIPTTNFYTRNGLGNTLLRNQGGLKFSDVTDEAGVQEGGLTLAIAWGDYDADGDQDIYAANDFGRNALFQNNGNGTFTDVAKDSGTTSVGYGMSASFEDIDNDGDLDIYVSGLHSGQRWFGNAATIKQYLVNSIKQGTVFGELPLFLDMTNKIDFDWQNFASQIIGGNSLMLNNGDGTFREVAEDSRANPHGWFWGSAVCDFDNDRRQDIFACNGWITAKKLDDL